MAWLKYLVPAAFLALVAQSISIPSAECKCTPNDRCWPSDLEFRALNKTVSGRLIRTVPPASVCYSSQPNYDEAACEYVMSQWFNSAFHSLDPTSIAYPIWANNTCPPIYPNGTSITGDPNAGEKGCTIGRYPAFAIDATKPSHVQAAVKFAARHNIRLNIKNSGHNFSGRSTAFGSLSIYTRNYRGIKYYEKFQAHNCPLSKPQKATAVAAGEPDEAVYQELAKHNAVIVGGSARTVGLAGWFTGGGHGPLSSDYGMGADNVLQVTMVTPQGNLITANACQNKDIFWAVRGGGGGTFGVILEVVMKAYPSPKATLLSLEARFMTGDVGRYWNIVAQIHEQLPNLKAGGVQGYYGMAVPPLLPIPYLAWQFLLYNKPNGTAEALFEPIKKLLDDNADIIVYDAGVQHFPNFYEAWDFYVKPENVATGGSVLGSRLLPASSLTSGVDRLAKALDDVSQAAEGGLPPLVLGHMVANSKNRGLDIAMNPGWRDAVTHLIVVESFNDYVSAAEKEQVYERMTNTRIPILKSLAPKTGAYFNEADPYDPDFQSTFWGKNYPRLRLIKEKYDPDSVLWCLGCAGSEKWWSREDGKLCRVPWAPSMPRS